MALIWSRNKIWGGTFNTDVNVSDDTNNASVVPATNYLGLKLSTEVDPEGRNRSKGVTSVIGQLLRAVLHIDENRATGSNIGVSGTGIESTQLAYTTPEQLPEIGKVFDDFLTPVVVELDGALTATQDMFDISIVNTNRKNKSFNISFSDFGIKWLKARTRLTSELVTVINSTIYGSGTTTGLIPVGTIWDYCGLDDPLGFINLCVESTGNVRSISKAGGAGVLKNNDYQNLFIKLYLSYADARCTVSGGRAGTDAASALNDFVSGKAISLPDYRGKTGGYYKLSDPNFGEIGKSIGAEIIDATKLPIISPWTATSVVKGGTLSPNIYVGDNPDGSNGPFDYVPVLNLSPIIVETKMEPNAGGDQKHFQPTIIQTAIIKY